MKLKGINKDINPIDTPENFYKGAANIVIEKEGAKSNERGFDLILESDFDGDFRPNGIIESGDGIAIVFGIRISTGYSEIGILKETNIESYTKVLQTPVHNKGLNFNINNAISGEIYRNVLGQYLVFWVDDINPPRLLNITELPFDVDGNKEPVDMEKVVLSKTFPDISLPFFNLVEVNDGGGSLEAGTYYFTLRYIYKDNTKTDWYNISNPIPIVNSTKGESFLDYKGSDAGTITRKSIKISIDNIDTNFPQYQIGIIKKIGGAISSVAELTYYTNDTEIIYTGLETEQEIPVNIAEILINNQVYTNIHTITQLDRRLYAGNVREREDLNYQPYANNITSEWVTKSIGLDSLKDSYKNEVVAFFDKGFMPDEVYAFYITFLFKDGGYSKAYHIPGRAPVGLETSTVTNADYIAIDPTAKNFHFINHAQSNGTMGYWEDEERYPSLPEFGVLAGQPVRHHKFPSSPQLESWGEALNVQEYNEPPIIIPLIIAEESEERFLAVNTENNFETDISFGSATATTPNAELRTKIKGVDYATALQYRAKKRQVVKIDMDWEVEAKCRTAGIVPLANLKIQNLAVRMIGKIIRNDEEFIFYDYYQHTDTSSIVDLALAFTWKNRTFSHNRNFTLSLKEGDIVEFSGIMYATASSLLDLGSLDVLQLKPKNRFAVTYTPQLMGDKDASDSSDSTSKVLGVKFNNIVIPPEIADKVQGYQIGYAKRDFNKSTCLTTAFMFPQNFYGDDANNGEYRLYSPDLDLIKPGIDPTYLLANYDIDINTNAYTPLPVGTISKINQGTLLYAPGDNAAAKNSGREECVILEGDVLSYPTVVIPTPSEGFKTFVVQNYYKHVTLKRLNKNIYNNFFNQSIVLINKFNTIINSGTFNTGNTFGGDIFKNYHFQRVFRNGDVYSDDPDSNTTIYDLDVMFPMVLDTIVNAGYIFEQTRDEVFSNIINKFKKHPIFSSIPAEYNIQRQYTGEIPKDKEYSFKEIKEFYRDHDKGYNTDYNSLHDLNPIVIKGIDREIVQHYHRVHRALPIGTEETDIKWRNFLPLDYYELETDKGVVWNLDATNTQLLIHLTQTLYRTQPIENLQLEGTNVTLGTGDLFKFPPQEILPDLQGYGGTLSQQSCVVTKFGYIFYDENRRVLNILSNDLKDISVIGLDDFFRDKMFITQNDELDEINFINTDIADNPYIDKGLTLAYDEFYNRLIICLMDSDRDKYYTASFDFSSQTWQSHIHNYNPNVLFHINNKLYSFREGKLYKHNSTNNKGLYYEIDGQRLPSESWIDVVFNKYAIQNKHFYGVNWLTEVKNDIGAYLNNETFNKIIIYNSTQASQEIDLIKIRNLVEPYNIRDTRGKWNFNKFRDIVINEVREGIQTILDEDENFIPSSVNNQKAWFDKKRFIDNFIVVRFIYSNLENKTLYLYDVDVNQRNASR